MLMDRLTTPSVRSSLTAIGAGQTGYSDVIDLSQNRDLAAMPMPFSVTFTELPVSGTGGATINVALQTSPDNATWTTLTETSTLPVTGYTAKQPWAVRGFVPTGGKRYLRFAYTPSASLTTGAVEAQVGADWPHHPSHPRNFVA